MQYNTICYTVLIFIFVSSTSCTSTAISPGKETTASVPTATATLMETEPTPTPTSITGLPKETASHAEAATKVTLTEGDGVQQAIKY